VSGRYRAIWKDGKLLAEYEGDVLVFLAADYKDPKRSDTIASPMIMRDMGEYVSPIDNSVITSRSAHRDHLKRYDVIEVGNEHLPPPVEVKTREIGEAIKRHVEEVKALPQPIYDERVRSVTNATG
jgi:hypothetical protein